MTGVRLDALARRIEAWEGRRRAVYLDHLGHPTCGVGHLMPADTPVGARYSDEQVDRWFAADLQTALEEARGVAGGCWDGLAPARREVLVDCVFQLGSPGLRRFGRMLAAVRRGDWAIACYEHMDSLGARQTPRRFLARARALAYGEWP